MSEPRIPMHGEFVRGVGTLIEVVDIPPPPPPPPVTHFIFESIEARMELRTRDGTVVKEFGTHTDFYGLNTSVEGVVKEAPELASKLGVSKDGEFELVVVKIKYRYPAKLLQPKERNFYAKEFRSFECVGYPKERSETVVWTTRTDLP